MSNRKIVIGMVFIVVVNLARLSTFDPCFNFFHADKLL